MMHKFVVLNSFIGISNIAIIPAYTFRVPNFSVKYGQSMVSISCFIPPNPKKSQQASFLTFWFYVDTMQDVDLGLEIWVEFLKIKYGIMKEPESPSIIIIENIFSEIGT